MTMYTAQFLTVIRKCSVYRRKTNRYAKSETGLQRVLNVYWVVHNFLRVHFTMKEVPAVSLGVIECETTPESLFSAQYIQLTKISNVRLGLCI
ncbi:hypothetical protein DESC_300089 [Desulfosarcina cetonica]|nr:hypothetical protein DESC_300089 [Desulfosarcina cetonica]